MNCYVLAGGLSSRIGVPKSSLQLDSKTFLERIVEAAATAFDEVVVVARKESKLASRQRVIFDEPHDDAAPVFGVRRALRDADGRCWIVGCDYPLLPSDVFRFFRESFDSDGDVLVPRWDGADQMLCAGYSPSLLPRIDRAIEQGRYSLRDLVTPEEKSIIDERSILARFPAQLFLNVNTPADYERAKEFVDGRRSAVDASR